MITAKQLVDFALSKLGTPYVYGMKGAVLTMEKYQWLKATYGTNAVWESDINKVGEVCCDCSGLISWATGVMEGSTQMYNNALRRVPITDYALIPFGALVWQKGHVGIYIGNGMYCAEDGSKYGCRTNHMSKAKFTHWLQVKYVQLNEDTVKEDDEVIREITIIQDGEKKVVRSINKEGREFVALRDLESDKLTVKYEKGVVVVESN